jgi:diguanylate cyclase (GGDEF)-like protein
LQAKLEPALDLEVVLAEAISTAPSLDAAFIGGDDGSFVFVGRSDDEAPGGFRTRSITFPDGQRHVDLSWTDASLNPLRHETQPDDSYDPRLRPWYSLTSDDEPVAWSPPYIFASSGQPGITLSQQIVDERSELLGVIGVDVLLSELEGFLRQLSPSTNGAALLINGQIVASSAMGDEYVNAAPDGALELASAGDIAQLIDELFSDERASVSGRTEGDTRTTVVRRVGATGEWYLAVQALDSDFIDTPPASAPQNVASVLVVGLVAGLGALLLGLVAQRYINGLRNRADMDALTNVMSRSATMRELETLAGSTDHIGLAIIDLDNLKPVNDKHGHLAGDAVLVALGERLRDIADNDDEIDVGRLGGDEFVLIVSGYAATRPASHWEQLREQLCGPVIDNDLVLDVSVSMGIALTEGPIEPIELLRQADQQLFQAKRNGRNTYLLATVS